MDEKSTEKEEIKQ